MLPAILRWTFFLAAGVFMANMITPNFSVNEMTCKCRCGTAEMDTKFMRMLQELRDQMQRPLRVSSGRRCDHHNDAVSNAKNKMNGVHTLGKASDILISGERAMLLFEKARKIGFSGIGLSQQGPHQDRFVHLDTKPRKALWSFRALI